MQSISKRPTVEERFWSRVDKTESCWNWLGAVESNHGYGRMRAEGVMWRAHRLSWTLTRSAIPEDLVIDHICRNRKCVNPDHLRAVESKVNALENNLSPLAVNALKTHCKRGHEFTEDNIITDRPGRRKCRTCARSAEAARRANWKKNGWPKRTCSECGREMLASGFSQHMKTQHPGGKSDV